MPKPPNTSRWPAAPHTLAKIAILKGYVDAWFPIMGLTSRGRDLLYIDGFAGPGSYMNHPEGSPIAALNAAARCRREIGTRWRAGLIQVALIESDRDRATALRSEVSAFCNVQGVRVLVLENDFENALIELERQLPAPFNSATPMFAFLDPFGPTGLPFHLVEKILRSPCSEVLINLDADGIGRIFQAGSAANHTALLDAIFGTSEWRQELSQYRNAHELYRMVLNFYLSRLRSIPSVNYAYPFEMRGDKDVLNYFLVFASQNPLGLEKMKESMKKLDQSGAYSFSDAHVLQKSLFRTDRTQEFADNLAQNFRDKEVTPEPIRKFALNETPYINAKKMLKLLESAGRIEVLARNPKRCRGTFSDDDIVQVRFGNT